jgi:hypothetical protein
MKQPINEIRRMQQLAGILKENEEFYGNYKVYEPSTFRKSSGYEEEVEQIKNLIKKIYPEYINNDIGRIMDADIELVSLAYKVYGINVSADDVYAIINNEDSSELSNELIQAKSKIEKLTGEPVLALQQAMKELNITT